MVGLTPLESAIMDRVDANIPLTEIARELGLKVNRVEKLARYYNSGMEANRLWAQAAVIANRQHLAAIAATGRGYM